MTLEYSSSRRMLWRWYWRSLRRRGPHRTVWLAWMVGMFLAGFSLAYLSGKSDSRAALTGLATSSCLAIFFAGYPQLTFKPQRRLLTLVPDELSTTIRGETKKYAWKGATGKRLSSRGERGGVRPLPANMLDGHEG